MIYHITHINDPLAFFNYQSRKEIDLIDEASGEWHFFPQEKVLKGAKIYRVDVFSHLSELPKEKQKEVVRLDVHYPFSESGF